MPLEKKLTVNQDTPDESESMPDAWTNALAHLKALPGAGRLR